MNILILLTANVSIKKWYLTKVIDREIQIYKELTKLGNNFTFLSWGLKSDKDYLKKKFKTKTENIFTSENKLFRFNFFRYLFSIFYVIKYINNFDNFDIIKSNQLIGSHIGIIIKFLLKKKFICRLGYEPNMFLKYNNNFIKAILMKIYSKIIYNYSDIIIVTTPYIKKFIIENFGINKKKIRIIPNYVDTEIFKAKNYKKNNYKKFVTITRFDKQKNLEFMFNEILIAKASLDVIGYGKNNEKYRKIIKKINAKIKFLGPINSVNISKKFSKYDFFISTSKYEGNPKTILESMSAKLPVIATSVEGIKDIIKDGKNGFIINNKKGSLARKLDLIKKDKINLNKISENARRYIMKNNSLSIISTKENKIYKELKL